MATTPAGLKRARSPSSDSFESEPKRPASEDPSDNGRPVSPASSSAALPTTQLRRLAMHTPSLEPSPQPDSADADMADATPSPSPNLVPVPSEPEEDRLAAITHSRNQPLKVGDTWYLLSRAWFRRFEIRCGDLPGKGEAAVLSDDELGPVNNSSIVDDNGDLRQGLREGADVELVPEDAWGLLIIWYGMPDHVLARPVLPYGNSGKGHIDFNPLKLHLLFLTTASLLGAASLPPSASAASLAVYPSQRLSVLYANARGSLPSLLPPPGVQDRAVQIPLRLWKLDESAQPELLKNPHYPLRRLLAHGGRMLPLIPSMSPSPNSLPVSSADADTEPLLGDLISSNDMLLLELPNPDGSWPVPETVPGNGTLPNPSAPLPVPAPASPPKPLFGSGASPPGATGGDFFSRLQATTATTSGPLTIKLRGAPPSPPDSSVAVGKGKEKEKEGRRGVVGLGNLGNTCFMNSALQCLAHTQELTEYFLTNVFRSELNPTNPLGMNGQIAENFGALLTRLWAPVNSSSSSFAPREFKSALARFAPSFSGYQQHDSQELLAFLLDGLHEDLNRVLKKPYVEKPDWKGEDGGAQEMVRFARECWDGYERRNDSVIVDLFQGQYKSTLVCPECGKVSITFDPYMYLTLPLPVKKTWRGVVCYVPWSLEARQSKVFIEMPKEATFKQLKQRVAELMHSDPTTLFAAEPYDHRFWKYFDDTQPVAEVADKDWIAMYELPCGVSQPRPKQPPVGSNLGLSNNLQPPAVLSDSDWILVPVFMALPKQEQYSKRTGFSAYQSSRSNPTSEGWNLMGHAFVLPLTRQQASDEACVYEQLCHRISRVTERRSDLWNMEPTPMEHDMEKEPVTEIGEDGDVRVVHMNGNAHPDPQPEPESGRAWTARKDLFKMHLVEHAREQQEEGVPVTGWSMDSTTRIVSWDERRDEANGVQRVVPGGFAEEEEPALYDDAMDKDGEGVQEGGSSKSAHRPLIRSGEAIVCEWDQETEQYFFGNGAASWDTWEQVQDPAISASDMAAQARPRGISLDDCLDEFTREEQLGEDDLWYCPRCKKHQQATKRFEIWSVPDILVVHLKRFSASRLLRDKIDVFVDFPVEGLDLEERVEERKMMKEIAKEKGADWEDKEPLVYDLYAVDEHLGGLGGGHYRAYAKNHADGEWYHFDDSHVTKISHPQEAVTANAYLLFYRRRTSHPIGGKTHDKIEEARKAVEVSTSAEIVEDNAAASDSSNPFLEPRRESVPLFKPAAAPPSPASSESSSSGSGGPSYSPPNFYPVAQELLERDEDILDGFNSDPEPRRLVVRGSAPSPYSGSTAAEMGDSGPATPDTGEFGAFPRVDQVEGWQGSLAQWSQDNEEGAGWPALDDNVGEVPPYGAQEGAEDITYAPPWANNPNGKPYGPSPPPLPTPPEQEGDVAQEVTMEPLELAPAVVPSVDEVEAKTKR